MAVTEFTSAISGSGKSYRRCAHFLATEFLPDPHKGKIYSNYPIHIDAMVEYISHRHPDLVVADLRSRICLIPQEELDKWMKEESGPWDYFKDKDLDGNRIALDEIHNFIGISSSKAWVHRWRLFLGELRHRGCEFEGLTQNDAKVHKAIKDEAGLKRSLFNTETRRDFFFGCKMYDWYQLRAKFLTGRYSSTIFEFEYLPLEGKWKLAHQVRFSLDPELFPLYDSYSTPVAGGSKSRGKVYEFQSKSHFRLIIWFLKRNFIHFSWRFAVTSLVFWVCFCGGGQVLLNGWISMQKHFMTKNQKPQEKTEQIATPPVVAPPTAVAPSRCPEPAPLRIGRPSAPGVAPAPAPVSPSPVSSAAPSVSPDQLKTLEKSVSELKSSIDALTLENQKLKSDNERLAKSLEAQSFLVMIDKDSVMLKNGQTYQIGEVITCPPFEGKKLYEINLKKRFARLSDGTVLSMVR